MHEAADGGLARIRLPGGVLSVEQLEVLAAASAELGDGKLELTSRGNIQIRALRPGAPRELSDRLYAAGLLPSITHERVRNILASPLSGLDKHSLYDVLPAAAELDRLLCARAELAELPGRFLFALDDGRGDLAGVGADVAIRVAKGQVVEGQKGANEQKRGVSTPNSAAIANSAVALSSASTPPRSGEATPGNSLREADEAQLGPGATERGADEGQLERGAAVREAGEAQLRPGGTVREAGEAQLGLGGTVREADEAQLGPGAGVREAGEALLVLGGVSGGVRVALDDIAGVMVAAAEAFLAERAAQGSEAWRVSELEDGPARILARLGLSVAPGSPGSAHAADEAAGGSASAKPPGEVAGSSGTAGVGGEGVRGSARVVAGWHEQGDGRLALVVTVPLGSLGQEQAAALVEVAGGAQGAGLGEIRVTPWRSVVLGGLAGVDGVVERLEAVGLVVEPESPWNGVTACAGQPGCAKALADVRADASRVTPGIPAGRRAVHWSGCERRCGRPAGEFVDVVAASNGYLIDGSLVEAAGLDGAVEVARRMRAL